MEAQQIFDTVAIHLAKQGHRAVVPGSTYGFTGDTADAMYCVYRAPNGDKCAFGELIPDAEYVPSLEKVMASTIFNYSGDVALPCVEALRPNKDLVVALQSVHDRVGDQPWQLSGEPAFGAIVPSIKDRLRITADKFRLDPAILDTLTFPDVWA